MGKFGGCEDLGGTLIENLINFFLFNKDLSYTLLPLKAAVPRISIT